MLLIGADHVAAAVGGDGILLLAVPVLWFAGVVVFIAFKMRAR